MFEPDREKRRRGEEREGGNGDAYLVVVVEMQQTAAALLDFFVALAAVTHGERGVHVHVVASEVQADEALEEQRPSGKGGA